MVEHEKPECFLMFSLMLASDSRGIAGDIKSRAPILHFIVRDHLWLPKDLDSQESLTMIQEAQCVPYKISMNLQLFGS